MKDCKRILIILYLLFFIRLETRCNIVTEAPDESMLKQQIQIDKTKRSCGNNSLDPIIEVNYERFCPKMFDGILCWEQTPAGTVAYQQCPSYVVGFTNLKGNATIYCTETGEWQKKESDPNRTYTNYKDCIRDDTEAVYLDHIPRLKLITKIGCAISLASLLIAIILMSSLRRLHCPRNILHVNLFGSFILFSIITLIKETFMRFPALTKDLEPAHKNTFKVILNPNVSHWECKLIVSLYRYSESSNHVMVFCEALYLTTLITFTTFNEAKNHKYFILVGWFAPLLWIVPYIVLMGIFMVNSCWSDETDYSYLYVVPQTILIVMNFGMFINIVRVLIIKIRNSQRSGDARFVRIAKSTTILVPLFSIYYVAFSVWQPYVKINSVWLELTRLYFEILTASFQGFIISCIYCYFNSEVRHEIIKIIERRLLRRNPNMRRLSSFSLGNIRKSNKNNKHRISTTQCSNIFDKDNLDQTNFFLPNNTSNGGHLNEKDEDKSPV